MALITASRRNNFVGGICALSSALLVLYASLVGVYTPLDVEQMFPFLVKKGINTLISVILLYLLDYYSDAVEFDHSCNIQMKRQTQ